MLDGRAVWLAAGQSRRAKGLYNAGIYAWLDLEKRKRARECVCLCAHYMHERRIEGAADAWDITTALSQVDGRPLVGSASMERAQCIVGT